MIVDLGTGDGRAVLAAAAADRRALVVGVDAAATAMIESSRRAAGRAGLSNAVFVASGVDRLPPELAGFADRVDVRFPWGSLLRGALGLDAEMTESIARLVGRHGSLEIALSLVSGDAVEGRDPGPFSEGDIARIAAAFRPHGLHLIDVVEITARDVAATRSSWARRLRVGVDRPAWRIRLAPPSASIGR